jgi:hypothetical protein
VLTPSLPESYGLGRPCQSRQSEEAEGVLLLQTSRVVDSVELVRTPSKGFLYMWSEFEQKLNLVRRCSREYNSTRTCSFYTLQIQGNDVHCEREHEARSPRLILSLSHRVRLRHIMAEKKLRVCKRRLKRVRVLAVKERLQKELVDIEGDPEYISRGDVEKPPLKSTKKREKRLIGDGLY